MFFGEVAVRLRQPKEVIESTANICDAFGDSLRRPSPLGGCPLPLPSWLVPAFHALGYHVIGNGDRLCPRVSHETVVSDCVHSVH